MYTDFEIARTVALPYYRARLSGDERGASMVEYALVLALVAVAGVIGLQFLGTTTKERLCQTGNQIAAADAAVDNKECPPTDTTVAE